MENQESKLQSLSIEQIEQLIEQTKEEISNLQQEITNKQNYLAELSTFWKENNYD